MLQHPSIQFQEDHIENLQARAGIYEIIPVHVGTRFGQPASYVNLEYVQVLIEERDRLLEEMKEIRRLAGLHVKATTPPTKEGAG